MRKTIYKVHKWIAATVGVFFLMWLISGIVMILPNRFYAPVLQRTPPPLNFREITVSPAEAVANLAKALGSYPEVSSVGLKRIRDTVVYHITMKPSGSHLIDARSGQVFTITPKIAEQIARDDFPSHGRVLQIDLVTRHTFAYPWGSLPAYRVVFNDDRATVSHVSMSDGTVRRSDRLSRIKAAIKGMHTFEPVKLITERDAVRKGLLLLLAVVGIGAAGTGYYLAMLSQAASAGIAAWACT